MRHTLKIQKPFADAIVEGIKTFEIRENERGYQKGDIIKFECYDGCFTELTHLINSKEYKITYVLSGYGLKEGYCVFGIEEVL